MEEGFQLQITEGPLLLIMASDGGVSIEDREHLGRTRDPGAPDPLYLTRGGREWTFVRLADLLQVEAGDWGQAIFLEDGRGSSVVVAAEQVRLVEQTESGAVKPFNMIGRTTSATPLFGGVWVSGLSSRLVMDRHGLAELAGALPAQ